MKLIVEIPADDYEYIKRLNAGYTDYRTTLKLYDAVRNGNPIPLGYTIGLAGSFDRTLDDIRKEIINAKCDVENDYDHGRNYGLYMATQIIDKYTGKE